MIGLTKEQIFEKIVELKLKRQTVITKLEIQKLQQILNDIE